MSITIDPSKWKITLPLYPPQPVLDNSTLTEYARCPRRGLYKYGMRRGFLGNSWPIQYGLAYHKYREVVEKLMMDLKCKMTDEINEAGVDAALEKWEDPPIDHKRHAHLDNIRLRKALMQARQRIEQEQRTGQIIVTQSEGPFDLELPFTICNDCHFANWQKFEENNVCAYCGSPNLLQPRHGGRIDQLIKFQPLRNADMVRDFKTTSSKGEYYDQKFDPNGQIQGYVWAGSELAGREFDGAVIETIYNTKTQGPIISQTYVTYSKGQQVQWAASVMIERQMIEMMWARQEELGYLAFPMRTNACQDYGGCRFRDACRSGSGFELNKWLETETIHSEWDFTDPEKEEAGV